MASADCGTPGAGEGRPRRGLGFAPRPRVTWAPAGPGRLAVLTLVALCAGLAGLVVDRLVVEAGLTRTAHRVPGVGAAALHPITCRGRPGSEFPTAWPSPQQPPTASGWPTIPGVAPGHPLALSPLAPRCLHHVTPSVGPYLLIPVSPDPVSSSWVPAGTPPQLHVQATHLAGTPYSTCCHWGRCPQHS